MSKAKYSPSIWFSNRKIEDLIFNAKGELPEPWTKEIHDAGVTFNPETMTDGHDKDGYDSYGYSAYDPDGNYIGLGCGVDKWGYTESDYDAMYEDDFERTVLFRG